MPNYRLEGQSWASQPITWDFAALTLPQDAGTDAFSDLITRQDVQAVVETAFEAWARAADIQFVYAPQDSAAVDIRIGWGAFPVDPSPVGIGNDQEIGETDYAYDTTTERFVPDTLIRLIDPDRIALSDVGGTLTYAVGATLYQVILHEIGHAIGLAHDTIDPFAVMNPYSSDANRQLAAVDMQGAQAIYGTPHATLIDIGVNRETVSGSLSGAPSTVFGSAGVLDYVGGAGLIVLGGGSASVHDGDVTVFGGSGPLTASNDQTATFILGSGSSAITGGVAGSTGIVFGGDGTFTYAGALGSASVIGGTGSASITGGAGGGYYSGGSDGGNSLTAIGIGTVLVGGGDNDTLVGAGGGYSYLVAGRGNETLIGSLGAGGNSGTDRFYLGSGSDAVGLGTGPSQLVTGTGSATIYGGGGSADLFGGTGAADLYVERPGSAMAVTGFRAGIDHVGGTAPASITSAGGGTVLRFADGATITLNGVSDPSGGGLFG